jgi:hypothetical protein
MPFRFLLGLALLLGAPGARAQTLPTSALPAGVSFPGRLLTTSRWHDNLGEHLLLLSVVDSTLGRNAPADSSWQQLSYRKELHAAHYRLSPGTPQRLWAFTEGQARCALDAVADFADHAPLITDLDEDGVCEVWLGYKTACTSSIGPQAMKVVLYRGEQALTMQGRSLLHRSVKGLEGDQAGFEGGDYRFDQAFRQAPKLFREFARAYWAAHVLDARSRAVTTPH